MQGLAYITKGVLPHQLIVRGYFIHPNAIRHDRPEKEVLAMPIRDPVRRELGRIPRNLCPIHITRTKDHVMPGSAEFASMGGSAHTAMRASPHTMPLDF